MSPGRRLVLLLATAGLSASLWLRERPRSRVEEPVAAAAAVPVAQESAMATAPGAGGSLEASPLPAYARFGDGFLVWESNRTGEWRIWTRRLDGSGLRQLTPDEPGRQHCCAHIAPDGASLAYLSRPGGRNKYEDDASGELHLVRADGSGGRVIAAAARSYVGGNRAVVWRSSGELIFIDGARTTRLLDLASGASRELSGPAADGQPWLIDPTLRFATGAASFSRYDPERRRVLEGRRLGGCEHYFSGDGKWGFWIGGAGGPIRRFDLASGAVSTVLDKNDARLHGAPGYMYFPMLSRSGELLAFGASANQHDHFRSNYDIFVAEVDPRTLELVADPVRFTDHPASDRYPDVFLAPLALGRHFGEAPFAVELHAPERGPDWKWSFGDGASAAGETVSHAYDRPGSYAVEAARGTRIERGRVVVAAAAPPRVVAVTSRDDTTVIVSFDEEIDPAAARASLGSGKVVAGIAPGEGGRTLAIRLAAAIAEKDEIRLEGVTDRAGRPNRMAPAALPIDPPGWPSHRDGLVFLFETADRPNLVAAPGGGERTWTLAAKDGAVYDRDRAMRPAGGSFVPPGELVEEIVARVQETNRVTLELTLAPASLDQRGPVAIAGFSPRQRGANFLLGQDGADIVFSLRRDKSHNEPWVVVGSLASTAPVHVVVGYEPGRLTAWLDGVRSIVSEEWQSDFFFWRVTPFAFGAEWEGKWPWHGRIERVAIYNRSLDDAEVAENARRYRRLLAAREVVPRVEVEARLVRRSRSPTLAEITPYHEGLVVFEHEVTRVLAGSLAAKRIRVVHWAILDDQVLAVNQAREGESLRLTLEPFARNPQLESLYLADTLPEDLELPLYHAVRE